MSATTGRRKHQPERKALVGARMKLAAKDAGYTTTVAMGQAMGCPSSTISRYWLGRHLPDEDFMARYAAVVRKPVSWFRQDGRDPVTTQVAAVLLDLVNEMMTGKDMATAYAQITGDLDRFGAGERSRMAEATPFFREKITREAGGDWQTAPKRRRREIASRLADRALDEQAD